MLNLLLSYSSSNTLSQLLLQEFQSEEIPSEKQDPEFNSPDIHILHLRRRVDWMALFALLFETARMVVCVCVSVECGVVGQMFDTEPYEYKLFLSAYYVAWEVGLNVSVCVLADKQV